MSDVAYWLAHIAGIDNLSGPWYGFWSGLGSDVTEFAIVGGLVSMYVRHTCHVQGCWRLAHRAVAGTSYSACRRHHPEPAPTHARLLEMHRQAKAREADLHDKVSAIHGRVFPQQTTSGGAANVPPAGLTGM